MTLVRSGLPALLHVAHLTMKIAGVTLPSLVLYSTQYCVNFFVCWLHALPSDKLPTGVT
jgi:hypothetical protein